ncbi:dephospho-CoA kinase [Tengunoibacter tsumagoiensis]|uniref:Dephospho-CoA kinase n=1 Tax=Tengunoibacter tsumagoiensis TaxID=2014871 RepID=A0A402A157_9CHLR|nr:dephospho-CoA kinase [Tengunoibacter tsumagoiensis]GCE12751.1 dephospho-CoA kinase [Tengunoibacter tsumagoiensis]
MSRVLGLTGNIASGKTTVGQLLVKAGAERYIDADALVHQLYRPNQIITRAVAAQFGEQMLAEDGGVDRKALGALVFHDQDAMQRLERIVHPAVHRVMEQELGLVSEKGIAVLDAVKLLEGGSAAYCQSIWLVLCPPEQSRQRLMIRNNLTLEQAEARLQAQPDRTMAYSFVDEIIRNEGTLQQLEEQVEAAFQRFVQKFPG